MTGTKEKDREIEEILLRAFQRAHSRLRTDRSSTTTSSLLSFTMAEKRKTPTLLDRFVVSNKRTTSTLPCNDNFGSSPPVRDVTEIDISSELSINLPGSVTETTTRSTSNSAEASESESPDLLCVFDARPETHEVDIGYHLSRKLSIDDEMKHRLLKQAFQPEKKYRFPARQEKGCVRRFLRAWLDTNPFLSYSPYYEGAFCSPCSLFSSSISGQPIGIFVKYPCSQYRHLKHFSTLVKTHQNSESHKDAMTRSSHFILTYEKPDTAISCQLDHRRLETIERNKAILLSVIKVIITCARQNIPLRGHRGESTFCLQEHRESSSSSLSFQMKR